MISCGLAAGQAAVQEGILQAAQETRIASLDAARFTQALPERRSVPDRRVGRPTVE